MKRILLILFVVFAGWNSYSQPITVNNTTYTVPQLVQNVLFAPSSGSAACVGTISNITWSTGTDFGSTNGIGYFTNTNPNFPLSSGVILSTGNALDAPGPNLTTQSNGINAWTGDTELTNYMSNLGIIDPAIDDYFNATILEFDFIPLTNQMSFEFLFASEEYGVFQCSYSDAFAFFLTNVTAGTPVTNLALVPSTTIPISVTTIHEADYYTGFGANCGDANAAFFGNSNTGAAAATAATNFNGETIKIRASSTVIPNNVYHIKLVISDLNDSSYDSAVFLGGGSFDIGTAELAGTGPEFGGITDFTGSAAVCGSKIIVAQAGIAPITGATYAWTLNGNPVGTNSFTYTITQAGTYGITITYPGGCQQTDTMVVEYLNSITLGVPNDITLCSAPFNLTNNTALIQNGLINPVTYHHTLADAQQQSFAISNASNYNGTDGEIIYASVEDFVTGCIVTTQFTLHTDSSLCVVAPIPGTPPDMVQYETTLNSGTSIFNFTPQTGIIYGTNLPSDYTVTYYPTLADANAGTNPIANIISFQNTSNPQRIYAVLSQNSDPTFFAITSFQLIVVALPTVNIAGSTSICSGSPANITFTGTPNATVDFTVNGNPRQIVIDATGVYIDALPSLITTTTYNLVSVTITTPAGTNTQPEVGSVTINVISLPTATISGTTSVCQNTVLNPVITFTGSNGIAPYTFTYSLDGGTTTLTTPPSIGNSITVPASTATPGTTTYTLISVQSSGALACSQAQSGSATVTVNPIPTAIISGTIGVCQNASIPVITFTGANGTAPYTFNYTFNTLPFSVTTVSGNSVTVAIPSTAAAASFSYNLIDVTDSSATTCSQNQAGSATVAVIAAPIINTPTNYVVCDDSLNNDGIYCFDLTTKDAEVTSDPNVVVTYHETLTNAQTGANPLISPYCNIDPGTQEIFVRAFNPLAPTCYSTTSFFLIVNPIPLPNPVITDYELCDYNGLANQEVFNLGTKTTEIANGQAGVTVTYYDSLLNAQNQTSPLPNLYTNTSNPQQIWINIKDNVTGCNTTSSFNLIVNPLPTVFAAPTLFECSNGLVLNAIFDLTINESTVRGGVPGLTVTYYTSLAAAQSGNPALAIASPITYFGADNEIVYIRVANDITGCYATTTQLLRVTQGPVAITPQPLQYCDPNNDGFGVFDLNDATNEIAGGIVPPGVSVSYHETPDDANIGANPIPLTTLYNNIDPGSQILYVRVFYTLTGCANFVQLKLNVNPTPEATEPADYELCDTTGLVGFENFNLNSRVNEILGNINPATVTVTFYTSLLDAQSATAAITNVLSYPNGIINTETLYVRVEFITTGCFDIVPLTLVVNPLPNATQPNYPQYSLCDVNQSAGDIGYEVFDLGSKVNSILLGQLGMDVHFYISLGDAQNDTNEITNLLYRNQIQYVQTLGIRITNQLTGCFVISTMDIRVEPLPTPIPLTAPYTICDNNQDGVSCDFDLTTLIPDILQGANYTLSFHETTTNANTGANPINIALPYCNIDAFVQTLYVRAVDNITGCYSIMPIELNVDPSPITPVLLDDIVVCDTDNNPQDANTFVDLTQRTPDVLAQQPLPASNYTVTYYLTQGDAQTGPSVAIIQTTAFFGFNLQTIWVRVENNNTQCFNIGSFQLKINTPLLLTTPAPLNLCDDDANPNNQFHVFNLTVKNAEITQNLPGYSVTYYPSLALAQAGVASTAIQTPTAYQNSIAAVQTLGVVVTTPAPASCQSITTLDIRVLPIPTPRTNPPALAPKCDDNLPGDLLEVFDLTVNEGYIANGDPNLTFHYFPTQADAAANNTAAEILPATAALVGTNVWIRVENNRVDYLGNNCYVLVEQALKVNPLPTVVQPLLPFRACDDNADGITVFNLADPLLAPQILGATQLPADYTISYYATAAGANPLTNTGETPLPLSYTNTSSPNTQTVFIRVVNNTTGCVNATGVLDLVVEDYATATSPGVYTICDSNANPFDGVETIDLNQFAAGILGAQDPAVFLLSYYTSLANAVAGTNPLSVADIAAYQTDADTDTIWVKVENSSNSITPFCYAIAQIAIVIERRPNPIINTPNGVNTICVNFTNDIVVRSLTLDSGMANPANYTFEWFETGDLTTVLGTGSTYTVDTPSATPATPRNYVVHVTNTIPGSIGCDTTSQPFSVIQSGQAVIPDGTTGYVISNAFSELQTITVNIVGYGDYQYSLDDGPRQDSNIFVNVPLGPHTIHVWDNAGGVAYSCEELIIELVQTIDYPYYFTPNGDGIHDTWNIVGLSAQLNAKIYIFDRYGKLMKQISSNGQGWDGTYNGHLLPADDYWFTVDFVEPSDGKPKQFRAHFSLKR